MGYHSTFFKTPGGVDKKAQDPAEHVEVSSLNLSSQGQTGVSNTVTLPSHIDKVMQLRTTGFLE